MILAAVLSAAVWLGTNHLRIYGFRRSGFPALACLCGLLFAAVFSGTAVADESVSRSPTEVVTLRALNEWLTDNADSGRMITGIRMLPGRSEPRYQIEVAPNEAGEPWAIHINMSPAEYAQRSSEFASQGYREVAADQLRVGRQQLITAVWQMEPPNADPLPELFENGQVPESGIDEARFEPINSLLRQLVLREQIPGLAVTVGYGDEILYSRAFGYADAYSRTPLQPEDQFRIASISKPMTSVAVLQMICEGQLSLDTALPEALAGHRRVRVPVRIQPWLQEVTVADLLRHTGGWDRSVSGDPMFQMAETAAELNLRRLPRPGDVLRRMFRRDQDFEPGTQYAYSNFGYCVLGRILEARGADDYETVMKDRILSAANMQRTELGETRREDRLPHEVRYHMRDTARYPYVGDTIATSSSGRAVRLVGAPYGRWDLAVMDAHGGWVSTAPDLVRFVHQLERTLLDEDGRSMMLQRPEYADPEDVVWYGCGWQVRQTGGGLNFWHTGSLDGVSTLLVRRHDGFSWAVLANINRGAGGSRVSTLVDPLMHRAVNRTEWKVKGSVE